MLLAFSIVQLPEIADNIPSGPTVLLHWRKGVKLPTVDSRVDIHIFSLLSHLFVALIKELLPKVEVALAIAPLTTIVGRPIGLTQLVRSKSLSEDRPLRQAQPAGSRRWSHALHPSAGGDFRRVHLTLTDQIGHKVLGCVGLRILLVGRVAAGSVVKAVGTELAQEPLPVRRP